MSKAEPMDPNTRVLNYTASPGGWRGWMTPRQRRRHEHKLGRFMNRPERERAQ